MWSARSVDAMAWGALGGLRGRGAGNFERALDEVDGLLLRLLDRLPVLAASPDPTAVHLRTFVLPALERLQHAAAATLVGHRYGVAGLRTVIADQEAPLARRYFAFLGLAELHPPTEWPVFARYLTPGAHHAFQGAAAEAARFYPAEGAAGRLVELFDAVRSDLHLRTFLSPRILESLYVLQDPATLSFFRELLTAGFTDHDPERCEVTRALVMVRRFTGRIEPSTKYPEVELEHAAQAIAEAEAAFERSRGVLNPVVVI
ncbi:MAG: hypothetical protein HY700_13760 [Gemmatimonadetes bacterium]|nr:hypothetical protein [Gemmatimonadota bacterium]